MKETRKGSPGKPRRILREPGKTTVLERLRLEAGLTGRKLAELSKTSANTIWRHERRMHHIQRFYILNSIAEVLATQLGRDPSEVLKEIKADPINKEKSLHVVSQETKKSTGEEPSGA